MLKASGNELFYYTFPSKTSNHLYEIEYLIYTKDLGKDKDVIFLPVYLVPFL